MGSWPTAGHSAMLASTSCVYARCQVALAVTGASARYGALIRLWRSAHCAQARFEFSACMVQAVLYAFVNFLALARCVQLPHGSTCAWVVDAQTTHEVPQC